MPQPTAYDRQFDFTQHEAESPSEPAPGVSLDAEYNAIRLTLQGVLANLVKIQRDDGALKNELVTLDSLAPAVLLVLGAGSAWAVRAAWQTGTAYVPSDVVSEGTATYVCGEAHTAAALFATDAAVPGRWVRIFDTAGVTPGDNSVTSAKIVDGAVTADKIGFSALDLTGHIRGQGGIAAGSAPVGSLFHVKKDTGDVLAKFERASDSQGKVGAEFIGIQHTWGVYQQTDDGGLRVYCDGELYAAFAPEGSFEFFSGAMRVRSGAFPTDGAGCAINYVASVGYVTAYDYATVTWKDLKLRGKDVYLTAGGVDILKATSSQALFLKAPYFNGNQLGYLGIPQIIDNDARVLSNADNGQHIYSENVAGQAVTLPLDMDGGLDFVVLIVNDGSNPITLSPATGVTLKLAGSAAVGARTIAAGGWCLLKRVKTNRYFCGGNGTS